MSYYPHNNGLGQPPPGYVQPVLGQGVDPCVQPVVIAREGCDHHHDHHHHDHCEPHHHDHHHHDHHHDHHHGHHEHFEHHHDHHHGRKIMDITDTIESAQNPFI
ncbi:hypothetical protein M3Y97_00188700 [Aphelenchoides bicaudatus]|nr:hypothetical protein M3Y97_00188700 [Aphelenchoides bicaudatus]